jgi:hypothetical protein
MMHAPGETGLPNVILREDRLPEVQHLGGKRLVHAATASNSIVIVMSSPTTAGG